MEPPYLPDTQSSQVSLPSINPMISLSSHCILEWSPLLTIDKGKKSPVLEERMARQLSEPLPPVLLSVLFRYVLPSLRIVNAKITWLTTVYCQLIFRASNQLYLIGQLWPISIFHAGSLFYFLLRLFDGIFSTILPDNIFFLKVDSKKHS